MAKKPASLVINLGGNQKRFPCLVLDSSKEGFRLRGSFHLRRGQVVELILDENPPSLSAAAWSGSAKLAPSRKAKSVWKPANQTCPVSRLIRA
jgi:hypothetical protein